jgi:hypothetical protein
VANTLLPTLQSAVKGLLYPSEQDSPIKAFVWPKAEIGSDTLDASTLKKQVKAPAGAAVEAQSVAEFLAPVTTPQSWYGEEEKQTMEQFQRLADTLKQLLTDLKVYRIGDTDKQVYVVGTTPEGDFAGISTRVVET